MNNNACKGKKNKGEIELGSGRKILEIFKNLFSALNKEAVNYMIAGGIALNLYGIERATADIDVVLKLDNENLLKFFQVAKKLELKPKVPVKIDMISERVPLKQGLKLAMRIKSGIGKGKEITKNSLKSFSLEIY